MKRKATLYQTRSYRIPVILDVSEFSENEVDVIESSLAEFKPQKISLPSDKAQSAIEAIKRKGYLKLSNLPCRVGVDECRALLTEVVNSYIGEDTPLYFRFPALSAAQSQIRHLDDVKLVIDQLLEQQDLRMLSYIFDLANLQSKVFLATKFNGLVSKLGDVSYKAGTAVLKEKKSKDDKISIIANKPEMDALIGLIKEGIKTSEGIDKELRDLTLMRQR